jgi:hypothetical protein
MSNSCPVLTPEERKLNDIVERASAQMMQTVLEALDAASSQVAAEWKSVETQETVVHQRMFLHLCGADAETMTGGDAELAGHLIRNQQNIVAHDGWAKKDKTDPAV